MTFTLLFVLIDIALTQQCIHSTHEASGSQASVRDQESSVEGMNRIPTLGMAILVIGSPLIGAAAQAI